MPSPHSRIALLIETSNAYGRELLRGIRAWAGQSDAGWSFRLVEQGRGALVPDWLENWDGDGIIARVENERIAKALETLGLPVVDVSAGLELPLFPQVVTNSEKAVGIALEHFRELGISSMAYCGDHCFNWSRLRESYYRKYIQERSMRPHVRSRRISKPETEIARLSKWLNALPKPIGVLACYDIRAQEVIVACREANLRVPDDVAIVGIHNDEILCELCDPPLTSVIPNARAAGFEAAALLSRIIEKGASTEVVHLIDPIGIAKRQSTDLVAIDDPKISEALKFINKNACSGITVQDVLREVPMARTQLERKFRRLLERSPREQIERIRMERVRELLIRSSLSISSIAEATGFEYPEYLTVAFKRLFGESPRDYRNREQR